MEKHNVLTVQKFDMVCRTCLSFFQPPYQCYTLLDAVSLNKTVGDMLKLHADVEVAENDDLPQNICTDCFENLHKIVRFVRRCRHADSRLHNILEEYTRQENKDNEFDIKPDLGSEMQQNTNEISTPSGSGEEIIQIKVEGDALESLVATNPDDIVQEIFGPQTPDNQYDSDVVEGEAYIEAEAYIEGDLEEGCEQQTIFICTICSEGFTDSKTLELHLRTHIIKPSDERMKESDAIMLEVIGETIIEGDAEAQDDLDARTCKICKKVFTTPLGLQIHEPSHEINNKKRRIKKMDAVDDVSNRMCLQCNKVFATKLGLQSHKVRHQEKAFTCDKCGYKFHTKAGLEIHYRSHSGEKPYKCSYCEKAFSQQGSLTLHTLTHTGERPHKCHLCPAAFKQGHHLQYHLQSHSGEKPYVCTICEKGFASKRNLIIHSRSHTGEKEYICPICNKGFYDRHGVNKHIKRHVFGSSKVKPNSENEPILLGNEYTTLDKLLFKGQR